MNLKYYLKIFQLEGYRISRFFKWLHHNYSLFNRQNGDPVWTNKAKIVYYLSFLIIVICCLIFFVKLPFYIALVLLTFLMFNSYVFLIIAALIIRPYELINRERIKINVRRKIDSIDVLNVIGIAGSFGKTSTKMILGQLLSNVLITPKSFNTIFGIYKTVDYELCSRYKNFICEMGAYKVGDIREMCKMANPNIGILTGINEQHLERFKTIEKTVRAKFEILYNLRNNGIGVVNLDNKLIRENLHKVSASAELIGYTLEGHNSDKCKKIALITEWQINNGMMVFKLAFNGYNYELTTSLLGKGHLRNILASIVVASLVEPDFSLVLNRVKKLKQIHRRLYFKSLLNINVLDDSYSSNPDGFREALKTLKLLSGKKILVTPGIVELGNVSGLVHNELGRIAADICDEILLIGNTERTLAFFQGAISKGFKKKDIKWIDDEKCLDSIFRDPKYFGSTFLIENVANLPENYL